MLIFDSLADPEVTELLNQGKIGVLPTDTLYGLVTKIESAEGVERLFKVKPREYKPGTVIAASVDQLARLNFKRRYLSAVEILWPNPISIIIPTATGLEYADSGRGAIPIRVPADKKILSLVEQTGPLLTTSANQPDCPPSTNIVEAQAYFGETVDFYVDGGDLSHNKASTIIQIIDDEVVVLREGAITSKQITDLLNGLSLSS